MLIFTGKIITRSKKERAQRETIFAEVTKILPIIRNFFLFKETDKNR